MKGFIFTEHTTVSGCEFDEQFITKAETVMEVINKWLNFHKDHEKVENFIVDTGDRFVELTHIKSITDEQYDTLKECGIQESNIG